MIAFLEEMIAKVFGVRQALPIRVPVDEGQPEDQMFKGRK